ncbi:hypothetical protein SAMN05443428_10673 [Caloramator quimbayensis]|uniref:Uncharacterized protein n=1 Tax=Caloramator quimbayensis TaxID=1147123 RepID=A0A1T4X5L4_9CLOT|nr:DUF5668 domain-containing protein [Caloramator quimbayensis]SKA84836.1 hypothetical protein SAMN05443428_10673 [Caloramator quimbayensis]
MNRNIFVGLLLVGIGIILIIQRTLGIDINIWNYLWPFFLIVLGIMIHYNFFAGRDKSNSLIFGGILLTYGLLFIFNTITNGMYHSDLYFVYPLGIGIGFFENYILGNRDNKSLMISIILIVISIYIALKQILPEFYNIRDYLFPVFIIIFGIYLLFKNKK